MLSPDYHILPILACPQISGLDTYRCLDELNILLRFHRQLRPLPESARALLPAFEITVLNGIIRVHVCGETGEPFTFGCDIRRCHPDYWKCIQYVKLSEVDSYTQKSACPSSKYQRTEVSMGKISDQEMWLTGIVVDRGRVFENDEVKPAASSSPPC